MRLPYFSIFAIIFLTLTIGTNAVPASGQSLQPRFAFDASCRRYNRETTTLMDITFVKTDLNPPGSKKAAHVKFEGALTVLAEHPIHGREEKPLTFTITLTDKSYEIDVSRIEEDWLPVYTKHFLVAADRKSTKDPTFIYSDTYGSHWIDFFSAGSFCTYKVDYPASDVVSFTVSRAI